MKLTSWAICSLALVAGVFGADRPELFEGLPNCTTLCFEPYGNVGFDTLDICNNKNLKHELDQCFSQECSDLERFGIARIHANACDDKPDDKRLHHYILLVAEIPAWASPWIRLYSSWITYESLSLDDYVIALCGLLYTVFVTLVHFGHSVTGTTIAWDAITQNITDGLKLVFMAEIFELACSCLLRVAILLVCLRISLRGHHMTITGVTILLTILSSFALALLKVFRCSPIEFAWKGWAQDDRDQAIANCLPLDSLEYAACAIDISLNVTIFAMLIRLISSRSTRTASFWLKQAIAVALGAFVLGVSGFRAQLLVNYFTKMQPVWEYHDRIIWMDVEISALIIWACLPTWQAFADSSNRSNIEERSLPTPLIGGANNKTPKKRFRRAGLFRFLAKGRTKRQAEHNLFLGDKTYGNVRTEIEGGQRFSMISQFTGLIGIQVKTRTTRLVVDNEWDAEKGSARENITRDNE
ncbi:Ff.00g089990.m01.CDS01 [Fusarium sp. VM40]|nr:Ff.00g089990.m01.CDS01 [Fusarium sp. VM40]